MTGVLGKTVEELEAYIGSIHNRLTDIVDDNLGSRPTSSIETLLTALEKELPKLKAKADKYDRQTDPEEESEMDRNARLIMQGRGCCGKVRRGMVCIRPTTEIHTCFEDLDDE